MKCEMCVRCMNWDSNKNIWVCKGGECTDEVYQILKKEKPKLKSQADSCISEHDYYTLMNSVLDELDRGFDTISRQNKIKQLFEEVWEKKNELEVLK
jgi:hypothetical protein